MSLYQIFQKAKKQKSAIGQFNFSCLTQLKGIVSAAQKLKAPVILGTSEGESKFFGLKQAIVLKEVFAKELGAELFLHLDHGKDLDYIKKAIKAGYDSVHFDGSCLDFEENIKLTRQAVRLAHRQGRLAEGELGYIGGKSQPLRRRIRIKQQDLTKPEQVEQFVARTGVDSLAIAIGNIHGIYASAPELDFNRLEEISERADVFLVLHGGSGIKDNDFKKAIKLGIQKVNINTDLRQAWKKELSKSLKKTKTVKPYEVLPFVVAAIETKVKGYIRLFGSYA